jgi:RND family efflux transporter MFP subunit
MPISSLMSTFMVRLRALRLSPRRLAIGIGVGVIALGGVGYLLHARSTAQEAKPQEAATASRPVQVQRVALEPSSPPRSLVGTLRARFESDYAFRIAGKIAERRVQAGDRVKTGDVLAMLDPADLRLALEQAEAEFSAASSAEKQAMQERDRIATLRAQGWSTEQAFDRQKTAVDEASSRRKRAERQVEIARNAQSYAELRAVADGVILSISAEAGQVVSAGQAVARLAQSGAREALVAVPEQALESVKTGQASLSLWSMPEKVWAATLRELSPNADAATRTFLARFSVPDLPPDAPLGTSLTLTLTARDSAPVARVPLSAILNEGGGPVVYVVEQGTGLLSRRKVEVMRYDARDAFITKGLEAGELVVTLGVHMLQAGVKVRPLLNDRAS